MLYINKVTADPQQQINLTGISGITIAMRLRFMPRIKQWIMGVQTGDSNIQGIAITTAPNILRQWRKILPFGMLCYSASGLDPFTVNDFVNGASNLYLLDSTDISLVEVGFYPQFLPQPTPPS